VNSRSKSRNQKQNGEGPTHVVDLIVEFQIGELTSEAEAEIRRHLGECRECAADYAWVEAFGRNALQQGLRHLAPARLVAMAEGRETAAAAHEEAHISACSSCSAELEWARREAPAIDFEESPSPLKVRRRERAEDEGRIPFGLALGALAALVRLEPLPVRLSRSASILGTFEENRVAGLEHYSLGNYAAAEGPLRLAAELRPEDGEIRLYLGSVELLQGRGAEAAQTLERALGQGEDPTLREEIFWQLAHARLAAGQPELAMDALREVVLLDSTHQDEAREILVKLAAITGESNS